MANPAMVSGGPSLNPGGRGSRGLTWQTYQNRSGHIIETKDVEEIRALARDEKLLSKKCSTLDALIVKDIDQSFDDYKARQGFLERALGKQVTRIGGENPGEGIKINATQGLQLESLDSESLIEIVEILKRARERQEKTIDGSCTEKNPPAITASGLSESE